MPRPTTLPTLPFPIDVICTPDLVKYCTLVESTAVDPNISRENVASVAPQPAEPVELAQPAASAVEAINSVGRVVVKKNPTRHASKTVHTGYLFPVKDVQQKDLSECLGKDSIRKVARTEAFQKEEDEQLTNEEERLQKEDKDLRLRRKDPEA